MLLRPNGNPRPPRPQIPTNAAAIAAAGIGDPSSAMRCNQAALAVMLCKQGYALMHPTARSDGWLGRPFKRLLPQCIPSAQSPALSPRRPDTSDRQRQQAHRCVAGGGEDGGVDAHLLLAQRVNQLVSRLRNRAAAMSRHPWSVTLCRPAGIEVNQALGFGLNPCSLATDYSLPQRCDAKLRCISLTITAVRGGRRPCSSTSSITNHSGFAFHERLPYLCTHSISGDSGPAG